MLHPVFTVDYEIHGNGDGSPMNLMVEPTDRLMKLLDEYGAKLTIMADVAEILKFKEYKEKAGHDLYHYDAISEQLCRAVAAGHDVQLHIHSSYFNAKHEKGRWAQDWSEYDFAGLPYERMNRMVKTGKAFLERLLRTVDPNYSCIGFRAANWSVSPSTNVVDVLVANGIHIDTSVFKYGRREGAVNFDYSHAHSELLPWRVSRDDICLEDPRGRLWEIPIYSENRWLGAFLTFGRVHRVLAGLGHKINQRRASAEPTGSSHQRLRRKAPLQQLLQRQAWKADFNQCEGRQLVSALKRAEARQPDGTTAHWPFVLIGHSKLFTRQNERSLRPFLSYVVNHANRFAFETLSKVSRHRSHWTTAKPLTAATSVSLT